MSNDSFVGAGLARSPYEEAIAERDEARDELRDLNIELTRARKERDEATRHDNLVTSSLLVSQTAYQLVWKDCFNLTEKVIPNIREELRLQDEANDILTKRVAELEAEKAHHQAILKEWADSSDALRNDLAVARALLRDCLPELDGEGVTIHRVWAALAMKDAT
jgi:prefoldin subunit 5